MNADNETESVGYCIYCKEIILKGKSYVVNEDGYMLHKECDDLISDNADYFAI